MCSQNYAFTAISKCTREAITSNFYNRNLGHDITIISHQSFSLANALWVMSQGHDT